jgi:hypothetical protein
MRNVNFRTLLWELPSLDSPCSRERGFGGWVILICLWRNKKFSYPLLSNCLLAFATQCSGVDFRPKTAQYFSDASTRSRYFHSISNTMSLLQPATGPVLCLMYVTSSHAISQTRGFIPRCWDTTQRRLVDNHTLYYTVCNQVPDYTVS